MSLGSQRWFWIILFLLMVISAFVVPFLPFFSNLSKVYGAFLYWCLFAVVVIISIGLITSKWRDNDER